MYNLTMKSIKDIENAGFDILRQNPNPPVKFRILRDILRLPADDLLLIKAKNEMLDSKWVKCLASGKNQDSERAIRRGLILGLDKNDPVMSRAAVYLADVLQGKVLWTDMRSNDNQCKVEIKMKAASLLSEIDPWDKTLDGLWGIWNTIAECAISSGRYDPSVEKSSIMKLMETDVYNENICLNNGYILTFLASRSHMLPQMLEELLLNMIWKSNNCMGHRDIRLHAPPDKADIKRLELWLNSLEILSSFKMGMIFAEPSVFWLWEHRDNDGLWDLWSNKAWMLSDNWLHNTKRKLDMSVRILILLRKNWHI